MHGISNFPLSHMHLHVLKNGNICVNYCSAIYTCADPESFARGGPTFFSFLIRGKRIQIALKAGHHWPASDRPFKWHFCCRADDGPTLNAGLAAL